jgi:hypothetical protein
MGAPAKLDEAVSTRHAPWLSWLQRPTVIHWHRKVVSSSLTGAVLFPTFSQFYLFGFVT